MKIIDDKGKVLGLINVIDLLVCLFFILLLPMFYYGYQFIDANYKYNLYKGPFHPDKEILPVEKIVKRSIKANITILNLFEEEAQEIKKADKRSISQPFGGEVVGILIKETNISKYNQDELNIYKAIVELRLNVNLVRSLDDSIGIYSEMGNRIIQGDGSWITIGIKKYGGKISF